MARAAHGAAVYGNKLLIFAGYDGNAKLNTCLWMMSLVILSFQTVQTLIRLLLVLSGFALFEIQYVSLLHCSMLIPLCSDLEGIFQI